MPLEQPPQPLVTPGLNVNAPPHTVNGNMHIEEPLVVAEPVTVTVPEPTPVVNGAVTLGADDGGLVLPPVQPEPQPVVLTRASNAHVSTEDLNQQVSDIVIGEDDSFQTQGDGKYTHICIIYQLSGRKTTQLNLLI